MLCSRTLVDMDEHVMQQVDAREDNFTLVELSDVLDGIIVEVALYRMDLVVEHESVDKECTYLTEEDRRYILRVLCCEVKEDTLLTAFSCEECKTAVIFLIGVSGLGISVNLIDEEYEGADIVSCHYECTYEVDDHSADTFGCTEGRCVDVKACFREMNELVDYVEEVVHVRIIREE